MGARGARKRRDAWLILAALTDVCLGDADGKIALGWIMGLGTAWRAPKAVACRREYGQKPHRMHSDNTLSHDGSDGEFWLPAQGYERSMGHPEISIDSIFKPSRISWLSGKYDQTKV